MSAGTLEEQIKLAAAGRGIDIPKDDPPEVAETENAEMAATAESEVATTTDGVEKSAEQAAPVAEVPETTEATSEEVQPAPDAAAVALAASYGLSPEDVQGLDVAQLQIVLDKFSMGIGQQALQARQPPAKPAEVQAEKPAETAPPPEQKPAPTDFDKLVAKLTEDGIDESVIAVMKAQQARVDSLEQRIAAENAQRQQAEAQRQMSQDEYTLLTSLQTLDEGGKLYGTNATRSEEQVANVNKVGMATVSLKIAEEQRTGRPVPITPELVKRAHAVAFPNRKPTPTVAKVTPQSKMRMGTGNKANVSPSDFVYQGGLNDSEALAKVPGINAIFEKSRQRRLS